MIFHDLRSNNKQVGHLHAAMAIFMFVSEYYFLEPGIKRVLKLFDAALERKKKVKDLVSENLSIQRQRQGARSVI